LYGKALRSAKWVVASVDQQETTKFHLDGAPAESMLLLTDNVQQGQKILSHQRKAGIAAMLHVSRDTVRDTLKELEAMKLIDYDYLQPPPQEFLTSLHDKPVKSQADWQASVACAWPLAGMKDGPSLARMIDGAARRMLAANYTRQDILSYLDFVQSIRVSDSVLFAFWLEWESLFARAEAETSRSRGDGRFAGANSLGLLKIETRTVLERRAGNSRYIPDLSDVVFRNGGP
jgi:hypothetical protein